MSDDETLPPPAADLTRPVYIREINKVAVCFCPPQTSEVSRAAVTQAVLRFHNVISAVGASPAPSHR
jgi:hypothetical protein